MVPICSMSPFTMAFSSCMSFDGVVAAAGMLLGVEFVGLQARIDCVEI